MANTERSDRQIGLLFDQLTNHAIPLAVHERPMQSIVHNLDRVREVRQRRDLLQQLDAKAAESVVASKRLIIQRPLVRDVRRLQLGHDYQMPVQL